MTKSGQNTRARGRPPLSKSQIKDMRDHISTVALRLYQEDGYEAISMRRLSKETGLTVMTIYKYFDSRIDILRAIWTEIFAELFDDLEQIAAQEPDPLHRLHAVTLGYVAYWLDHTQHYFTVFMSKGISQSDVRGFIDDKVTLKRFELLENCLSAVLANDLDPTVRRVKFEIMMCLLHGICHNLITVSSYPWSEPKIIVREAIEGLVAT